MKKILERRPNALNTRQATFCMEYIVDFNATQAAIRAGYSAKSAHVQAFDLLKKPKVAATIAQLVYARAKRTEITADRVIQELACLAFLDPSSICNPDGTMLNVHEMPEDARRAISGIEVEELYCKDGTRIGRLKKVKFWSKPQAAELLGKHLRIFSDKVADTININHQTGPSIQEIAELTGDPEGFIRAYFGLLKNRYGGRLPDLIDGPLPEDIVMFQSDGGRPSPP